jgi:signal transduction histidine kinase
VFATLSDDPWRLSDQDLSFGRWSFVGRLGHTRSSSSDEEERNVGTATIRAIGGRWQLESSRSGKSFPSRAQPAEVEGFGGKSFRGRTVLAVGGVVLAAFPGLRGVPALPLASAVVAAVAAAAGLLCRPHRNSLFAGGASVAATVSLVDTLSHDGPHDDRLAAWLLVETAFMLLILVQLGRRPPARVAIPVTLVVIGAIVVSSLRMPLWLETEPSGGEIVGLCCGWALLAGCATALGIYLRSLDEGRERSVVAARREQRVRLARDLHDWLSHEMTGIVLEAQAAQLGENNRAEIGLALKRIEEAGVRALDSMDRAIRLMGAAHELVVEEPPPSVGDLAAIVRRFSTAGAARVRLDIEEGVDALPPETAATVHRVVLESLTNTRRHAPTATAVRIRVRREGLNLIVVVTDDGEGCRATRPFGRRRRSGVGLASLAERVEALGGTFRAGFAEPRGWSVRVVLPVVT